MGPLRSTLLASLILLAACAPAATGVTPTDDTTPTDGGGDDTPAVDGPVTPDGSPTDRVAPDSSPSDVADDTAQTDVPKMLPDVTPDVTPDITVDTTPDDAPIDIPVDIAPDVTIDTAPDVTPDITIDIAPADIPPDLPTDTGPRACTTSRMCPGQVCDVSRGLCVDCVVDSDCLSPTTEICVANACVPRPSGCRSDADCSGATPHCALTTHACVECVATADCGAGRACSSNTCVTRVCTPSAVSCADTHTRRECSSDGMTLTNTPCPDAPSGTGTCTAGSCSLTCTPGTGDCDHIFANGCEVNGFTDPMNCGGCGIVCPAPAGIAAACTVGHCSLVCPAGHADCDGNPLNGCEADLATSATNCGRCGNVCSVGACGAGVCSRIARTFGGPTGIGTNCLVPNDDSSWTGPPPGTGVAAAIDITPAFAMGLSYFGTSYRSMYVNNNGNITFRGALGTFTPAMFPVAMQPMIAPWWGDVDTRGGGQPARNNVCFVLESTRVIVTWDRVGYYATHDTLQNTFQLFISTPAGLAAGDFNVEFRYELCQWTTGDASGGMMGLGGTPAQAGFDAGDMRTFVTLPMSGTAGVLNLCTTSNVSSPGIWRYQVRSGVIRAGM